MDIFLIAIVFVSVLVAGLTLWFLHWLKLNYPQAYDDPAMAGLGGFSGFTFIACLNQSALDPYNVLVASVPIFIAISFMSAGILRKKLTYSVMSVAVVLIAAIAAYVGVIASWVAEIVTAIVFCILWVLLFRWRYVHNQNN
ncbi:hypothetical protein [Thalassolituus oleivorans]|uniref:hypothetical protein n=1 Tax=Thalassolituus oleivorans TaxID=187493 RepID=UPI0023EFC2E8|nr:hypothetical protein [Thalassolituus oleivorans]